MIPTERQVADEVLTWKARRKPPLSEDEVEGAVRALNMLGWIKALPSESILGDPELAEIA